MDDSPTSRSLRCLGLVQARPGISAADLAARLGVTTRAVRRYVAILREAEIPVEATSGPYGGYRLGRGVRMPPLLFSESEALGLTMAVMSTGPAADADDPVAAALSKLVATLPGRTGEQAASLWHHAVTQPTRWGQPDATTSSTLVTAVTASRRVRLTYRSAGGRVLERTVDPWAVVARRHRWYLLGHDHGPDEVRTYRLDRVEQVDVLDEGFDPPDRLDPVAVVEEHLGSGRRYPTRVRFDAPLHDVAPWVGAVMGRLEPDPDDAGRCVLTGSTDNPAMYAGEWLAALPFAFRVLDGPELRDAVAALAVRFADAARSDGA